MTDTPINVEKEQLVTTLSDSIDKELEVLIAEQEKVAKEILAKKEEEKYKTMTNPSNLAITATPHEAGTDRDVKIKKSVKQLFNLYLLNQYVNRAINIRADTLISRGYKIVGKDQKGVDACKELIDKSGGINLFRQLSVNTDIAGDGFLEKIYNQKKNMILKLKHVHPLTLEFKTDEDTDKIVLDSNGEPKGYVQYYIDENGQEQEKDIDKSIIAHLKYNTLGDEFTGLSQIQSGYNSIVRLMNMEYSAAEAAVKAANPIIVGKANSKSPHQIAMWGQILGRINGKEQVFIPEGMELSMLAPERQIFSDYAEYFLNAVVATFGVPKGILLGSSSGGSNRAEEVVLSRQFYSTIRANQKYQSDMFNEIFKEYGELAGFEAPRLEFEDIAEDAEAMARSAIDLFTAQIITQAEARAMIGLYALEDESAAGPITDPLVPKPKVATSNTTQDAITKAEMKTNFPAEPGSPSGSQKGIKIKQKASPNSLVSPLTK